MKSETVQEILDKIYVVLTEDSNAVARRAHQHIILLDDSKYYAIEQADSTFEGYAGGEEVKFDGENKEIKLYHGYGEDDFSFYVYPTGNDPTKDIWKISKGGEPSGRVTGLDKDTTYRVRTAVPVTGTLVYTSSAATPTFDANSPTRPVTDGTISLPELEDEDDIYYLNITRLFDTTNTANISIAEVGKSAQVTAENDGNGVIYIELGTQTDYIFAEFTDSNKDKLVNFLVLTVKMTQTQKGELTINLTPYSNPGEGITKLEPTATVTFSVSDFETRKGETLTITAVLQTGVTITGWYFGDIELDDNLDGITISNNSSTIKIEFDEIDYTLIEILGVGKHYITVSATSTDGAYWAAKIEVEVTDN